MPSKQRSGGRDEAQEEGWSYRQQKRRDRVGGREQRCPAPVFPGFARQGNKAHYKWG